MQQNVRYLNCALYKMKQMPRRS